MYIDGYAGRGQYESGSDGSSGRMLEFAAGQRFGQSGRQIDLFLCEKDPESFTHLEELASTYRRKGIIAETRNGRAEDFLPEAIQHAEGLPAFIYLDPCGVSVPFEQVVQCLNRTDRSWPPTELLLNFSIEAVRRIGGHIASENGSVKTIATLDRALGGTWWHNYFEHGVTTESVNSVVAEYMKRLGARTNCHVVSIPVHRRPGRKPIYHLVFATRHGGGVWNFADKAARAIEAWWRRAAEVDGGLDLYPHIEDIETGAVATIAENIAQILSERGQFKLGDHAFDVFGNYYGLVRETTARKAVQLLYKERRISSNGVGVKKIENIVIDP
ncbi:hypothetical protein NJ76_28245 [Rhodococcus sp. IITR03]|nr:hypothetical protein NJ76_28245 [Rhodococcus sp. IITR03]